MVSHASEFADRNDTSAPREVEEAAEVYFRWTEAAATLIQHPHARAKVYGGIALAEIAAGIDPSSAYAAGLEDMRQPLVSGEKEPAAQALLELIHVAARTARYEDAMALLEQLRQVSIQRETEPAFRASILRAARLQPDDLLQDPASTRERRREDERVLRAYCEAASAVALLEAQLGRTDDARRHWDEAKQLLVPHSDTLRWGLVTVSRTEAEAGMLEQALETAEMLSGILKDAALRTIVERAASEGRLDVATKAQRGMAAILSEDRALLCIAEAQLRSSAVSAATETAEGIHYAGDLLSLARSFVGAGIDPGTILSFAKGNACIAAERSARLDPIDRQYPMNVEPLLDVAEMEHAAGIDPRATLDATGKLIAQNPREFVRLSDYAMLAKLEAKLGNTAHAEAALEAARQTISAIEAWKEWHKNSFLDKAWAIIAAAEWRIGRGDRSEDALRNVGSGVERMQGLILLAEEEIAAGDAENAQHFLVAASKLVGEHGYTRLLLELGSCMSRAGMVEAARKTFSLAKTLSAASSSVSPNEMHGVAFSEVCAGFLEEAMTTLEEAARRESHHEQNEYGSAPSHGPGVQRVIEQVLKRAAEQSTNS